MAAKCLFVFRSASWFDLKNGMCVGTRRLLHNTHALPQHYLLGYCLHDQKHWYFRHPRFDPSVPCDAAYPSWGAEILYFVFSAAKGDLQVALGKKSVPMW